MDPCEDPDRKQGHAHSGRGCSASGWPPSPERAKHCARLMARAHCGGGGGGRWTRDHPCDGGRVESLMGLGLLRQVGGLWVPPPPPPRDIPSGCCSFMGPWTVTRSSLRIWGWSHRGWATPLCDIPSGCCSFTGPWAVTRSSLRMLHHVAAFCRPLRPVLLLVSFPRSRSPVVGVLGLC